MWSFQGVYCKIIVFLGEGHWIRPLRKRRRGEPQIADRLVGFEGLVADREDREDRRSGGQGTTQGRQGDTKLIH